MSEQSPIYYEPAKPTVEAILTSKSASTWLKTALQNALDRDPVDAANDAEVLASVLASRCAAMQGTARG
jgi:hypothetical protein